MKSTNHFFTAFFTIILSICAFYGFKALLRPEGLFANSAQNYEGDDIAVDSAMLLALAEPAEPGIVEVALIADAAVGGAAPPKPAAHAEAVKDAVEIEVENEEAAVGGMLRFFQKLFALEETQKGSVRIAYFGDSMIEGDLIVQDLRKSYQKRFGGQGIGFVPLSSLSPHFGASIRYEHSPEWVTYSALKNRPAPLGVSCYVSFAGAEAPAWTRFRSGAFPLANPTLYYGWSDNGDAAMLVTVDGAASDPVPLKPAGTLNRRSLASWPRELTVQFDGAQSIPFYGVNFSGGSGVNIDDFALRGSSGLPLSGFNAGLMNAFQREFGYDLLVLQFGANVLKPNITKYDWYATGMAKVVNHLKRCFPGADILVISQADKATKYGTEMKTDTTLASLLRAQEKYARNTGAAFIDLFQLMGGEGSMVEWASAKPSLAVSDYTHFNAAGAKKIAGLIYERLSLEYEDFKRQNSLAAADGAGNGGNAEIGVNENNGVNEVNGGNENE
jgi:lysophospholipase L1-like esterase